MTSKISFFIVLLAAMIFGGTTANAETFPANSLSIADRSAYTEERKKVEKEWVLPSRCDNGQAKILFKAGFNKPGLLRGAWAITWRESKHQSLTEASRWYSGALGTWQIQTSAWAGKSWWSRSAMLDKHQQSVIVKKHFVDQGLMSHWGYSYSKSSDTWSVNAGMYYRLWGSQRTHAWVIAPFNTGWSLFPKKCTPVKK
jgi:hypothetical protein